MPSATQFPRSGDRQVRRRLRSLRLISLLGNVHLMHIITSEMRINQKVNVLSISVYLTDSRKDGKTSACLRGLRGQTATLFIHRFESDR